MIEYKNFWDGSEVLVNAKVYTKHLAKAIEFELDFFKAFPDLIECYCVEPYSNGTVLYKVKYKTLKTPICILWGPLKNSGIKDKDDKRIQVLNSIKLVDGLPYFAIGAYNTLDTILYVLILDGVKEFIKNAREGRVYSSLWVNYENLLKTYRKGVYNWEDGRGRRVVGCKEKKIEIFHTTLIEILTKEGVTVSHGLDSFSCI